MSSHCCGDSRSSERTCSGQSSGCKKCQAFRVGRVRQDARTARLVTQLQTRTPPSTFSWSIHRWRDTSPLSILSALRLRASPSIRDSGWSVHCGVVRLGCLGEGLQSGQKKALRGRRHRAHKGRAKSRQRKLLLDCVLFVFPNLFTLSLACSVSALYLTSTSPTRHAPRRSRDLPRHTPS